MGTGRVTQNQNERRHLNGMHCTLISHLTPTESKYLVREDEFAGKGKPPEKNQQINITQLPCNQLAITIVSRVFRELWQIERAVR